MSDTGSRGLSEAGLAAALGVLLALAAATLPVLGAVAGLVVAVPIAVLAARHGPRMGVLGSAVTGVGVFALLGPGRALSVASVLLAVGVPQGWALRRRLPGGWVVLLGTLGGAAVFALTVLAARVLVGIDLVAEIASLSKASLEETRKAYVALGMDPERVGRTTEQMQQALNLLPVLLPALVLLASSVLAAVSYLTSHRVLRTLGYGVRPRARFSEFRLPWYLSWGLLVGMAGPLLVPALPGLKAGVNAVSWNLLVVFAPLFLAQGLAVGYALLRRWRVPVGLAALLLASLALVAWPVLTLLGVFDVWLDFRGLEKRAADAGESEDGGRAPEG